MARTHLVAANWKMHPAPAGWDATDSPYQPRTGVDVVVFPAYLDIAHCLGEEMTVGAQCGRAEDQGAFTGDISMKQLKECGCRYVLCGHSDRRHHHSETDAMIAAQVHAAINVGLIPILCIGETAEERKQGNAEQTVKHQLSAVLKTCLPDRQALDSRLSTLVLAYEPVWAIGNGKTATPKDAQEMHAYIRKMLPESARQTSRILYGGSVKADNAADLIAQPDIDGFLVGAASLDPEEFKSIVAVVRHHSLDIER